MELLGSCLATILKEEEREVDHETDQLDQPEDRNKSKFMKLLADDDERVQKKRILLQNAYLLANYKNCLMCLPSAFARKCT